MNYIISEFTNSGLKDDIQRIFDYQTALNICLLVYNILLLVFKGEVYLYLIVKNIYLGLVVSNEYYSYFTTLYWNPYSLLLGNIMFTIVDANIFYNSPEVRDVMRFELVINILFITKFLYIYMKTIVEIAKKMMNRQRQLDNYINQNIDQDQILVAAPVEVEEDILHRLDLHSQKYVKNVNDLVNDTKSKEEKEVVESKEEDTNASASVSTNTSASSTTSVLYSRTIKQEDTKCNICLTDYKNNDNVINLKCDHHFHKECLVKWININEICPLCKKII